MVNPTDYIGEKIIKVKRNIKSKSLRTHTEE